MPVLLAAVVRGTHYFRMKNFNNVNRGKNMSYVYRRKQQLIAKRRYFADPRRPDASTRRDEFNARRAICKSNAFESNASDVTPLSFTERKEIYD